MKKRCFTFFCAMLIVISAVGSASAATFSSGARLTTNSVCTVVRSTALRGTAGSSGVVIERLSPGSNVNYQYLVGSDWCKVTHGSYEGFVLFDDVCETLYCYKVISNRTPVYEDYNNKDVVKDYLSAGVYVRLSSFGTGWVYVTVLTGGAAGSAGYVEMSKLTSTRA